MQIDQQLKHLASTAFLMVSLFVLTACSDSEIPSTEQQTSESNAVTEAVPQTVASKPLPVVLETYEVGKDIFVRALKVDQQANTIWVGTSVGVHEISLEDFSPVQTFTREHGLANEYVFAVGIDHQGYKWFGTNAGGVSRYKDEEWKTYFPMHGLADYWVYSFASQSDGTFWIGTWAGVNRVDAKTGEFTTYVNELVNEWVYGIDVDSKDRVWFGTEGGVTLYDGKSWRSWTHMDGLGGGNGKALPPSTNTGLGTRSRHDLGVLSGGQATYNPNYVFALTISPEDHVWVGTWGGGVSKYDGEKWTSYTTRDGLAGDIVYSVTQDADGVFWFGTNGGVSRFDGTSWRNYGLYDGLTDLNVYALEVAPNGDVWAGTRGAVIRIGQKQQ